jgi:putative ABC transport system permease protein
VNGVKRSTGKTANLPLRGIGQLGEELRRNVKIVEGRIMTPGTNEIVVGRAVERQFLGFQLGEKIKLGPSEWLVVGIFEAGGSVFDSEVWSDFSVTQSLFRRINSFQTIRARLETPAALGPLIAYAASDPRLTLDIKSEAEYFSDQASRTSDLIQKLGWPLALIMGFGALAGALNAMYSSVAARTVQIATLRAIGFGGFAAFVGTITEALILAACGGLVGALATLLVFDGFTASTLGGNMTQIEFSFRLTPGLVMQGIVLALVVGLIGGLFPALRAARAPIAPSLHAS